MVKKALRDFMVDELIEICRVERWSVRLILCTGKSQEHIELLQLQQSNIRVADYLKLLPSREVLQAKLHQSIELARPKLNFNDAK